MKDLPTFEELTEMTWPQQRAVVRYLYETIPGDVPTAISAILIAKGLLRSTGPRHRSFRLSRRGRDFALAILARPRTHWPAIRAVD